MRWWGVLTEREPLGRAAGENLRPAGGNRLGVGGGRMVHRTRRDSGDTKRGLLAGRLQACQSSNSISTKSTGGSFFFNLIEVQLL